jgi:hypothetical protein
MMTAALGTLPFLATLWLLVVLGARVLEESGARIAAALKGQPLHRPAAKPTLLRIRLGRTATLRTAQPRWRAAA